MDPEAKKKALRMFTYGLYVVTAADGGNVAAGTVTWLSQASFTPPLVMVALKVDSSLYDIQKRSGAFGVNILGEGQEEMAQAFFGRTVREDNRLNGYAFETGETGSLLLLDAPAFVECREIGRVERGDHTVVVAEVVNAGVRREARPLALSDTPWSYGG